MVNASISFPRLFSSEYNLLWPGALRASSLMRGVGVGMAMMSATSSYASGVRKTQCCLCIVEVKVKGAQRMW